MKAEINEKNEMVITAIEPIEVEQLQKWTRDRYSKFGKPTQLSIYISDVLANLIWGESK